MQNTVVIDGNLSLLISGEASAELLLMDSAEVGIFTAMREILPIYDGATTYTPSDQEQTIQTNGKSLLTDIIINPVPNNYGLITWNGSYLTVS